MAQNAATPGVGGIAWKRYAAIAVPAFVIAGATVLLAGQGALAASFAVSGNSFTLTADTLDGTGFVSYGQIDTDGANGVHPVTPSGFKSATLTNLCQSVVTDVPVIGPVTMKLTAGKTKAVVATDMVSDFDQLSGDITFTDYASGLDASTLSGGPVTGPAGTWGQQARIIHIDKLKQRAWRTTAGKFELNGLNIDVSLGKNDCP